MSKLTNAVCFTCGLVIESPPRLSRLTNGQACPACRDRVLDGLPSALPSRTSGAPLERDLQPGAGETSGADESDPGSGPEDWDRAS